MSAGLCHRMSFLRRWWSHLEADELQVHWYWPRSGPGFWAPLCWTLVIRTSDTRAYSRYPAASRLPRDLCRAGHQRLSSMLNSGTSALNRTNSQSDHLRLCSLDTLFGLPRWLGKDFTCQAGYAGSFPGSERSPEEGNGNPLQYSCLGNLMDKGAWQAIIPQGCKKRVGHDLATKQ